MIIGISGKIGSGKDTVAFILNQLSAGIDIDSIAKHLESGNQAMNKNAAFEIKKFAYNLKLITSILVGVPVEDLEKREIKDRVLGPAWDYQLRGTHDPTDPKWITEYKEGWGPKLQYTIRELLQKIGTEAMRNNIHPNVWVNSLMSTYDPYHSNWIITDVRFPNEADAVKNRGGILLRMEYPDIIRGAGFKYEGSKETIRTSDHISETALDDYKDFDFIIKNRGSFKDLATTVASEMGHLV